MKRIVIAAAMSLCVVSLTAISSADTLIMRDGTRVEGIVVGMTKETIMFRQADGITRRYSTSQVEGLEFLSAEHSSPSETRGRSPEMVVDLQSITVDGRPYLVSTTDLTLGSDPGIGKNKRSAETIGGAALGTIIGAIASRPKRSSNSGWTGR